MIAPPRPVRSPGTFEAAPRPPSPAALLRPPGRSNHLAGQLALHLATALTAKVRSPRWCLARGWAYRSFHFYVIPS